MAKPENEIDSLKNQVGKYKRENGKLVEIYERLNSKLELCYNDNEKLRKEISLLIVELRKIYPVFVDGDVPSDVDPGDIKNNISDIMDKIEQICDSVKNIIEYRNNLKIDLNKKTEKPDSLKYIDLRKPKKEDISEDQDIIVALNSEKEHYYNENEKLKKDIANLRKEIKEVCPDIEAIDIPEEFDIVAIYKKVKLINEDIERMYEMARKIIEYRSSQRAVIISELEGDKKK